MTSDPANDITALLARWREGDRGAESALLEKIYPALRDIARSRLRGLNVTLSTTDLAHETYARLSRGATVDYRDRSHFFAVAARATRHFIIDHLRSRLSDKRGGGMPIIPLDDIEGDVMQEGLDLGVDWVAVHEALNALERIDSDSARIVELKFFSGLTTDEIAETIGFSRATVVRSWRFAKAWLADRLQSAR